VRHGGRFAHLWIAVVMHGLTVEMVSYWVPDIDNFWHAQTMIMFLGKRLPLYVVCACKYFMVSLVKQESLNLIGPKPSCGQQTI
jgi:hypothetical protein